MTLHTSDIDRIKGEEAARSYLMAKRFEEAEPVHPAVAVMIFAMAFASAGGFMALIVWVV